MSSIEAFLYVGTGRFVSAVASVKVKCVYTVNSIIMGMDGGTNKCHNLWHAHYLQSKSNGWIFSDIIDTMMSEKKLWNQQIYDLFIHVLLG